MLNPTSRRVYVIGDVHGCLDELLDLLIKCDPGPNDKVIFLGDLLDKGPKPLECLRLVRRAIINNHCPVEVVLSNHEEHHARYWRRTHGTKPNNMKPWHDTRDGEINAQLTEEEVAWIESLPAWVEIVPGWVAVHGGFDPRWSLADQDKTKVLRIRWVNEAGKPVATDYDDPSKNVERHWSDLWRGPESVVYGHHAFSLSRVRVTRKSHNQAPRAGHS